MYEFLKKLFGTGENGEPEAMTYEQLEAKINESKDLKIVNLKDDGYVSKEKFEAKDTELKAVQKQLEDANAQIQSFKDVDVDGIKGKVSEWEKKYAEDTEALKKQMEEQEVRHQRDLYFSNVKFASNAAKNGILMEFDKQGFQLKDGKFQGADDWLAQQKKDDPASFVLEDKPAGDGNGDGADGNNGGASGSGASAAAGATNPMQPQGVVLPTFATATSKGSGVDQGQMNPFGNLGFRHVKQPEQK